MVINDLPDKDAIDAKLAEAGGHLRLFPGPNDVVVGNGRVDEIHEDVLAPLHGTLHLGQEGADVLTVHVVSTALPLRLQHKPLGVLVSHSRNFVAFLVLKIQNKINIYLLFL